MGKLEKMSVELPRRISWYFTVRVLCVLLTTGTVLTNLQQNASLAKQQTVEKKDDSAKSLSTEEIHLVWHNIKTVGFPGIRRLPAGSEGYWLEVTKVGFDELKKIIYSSNPRQGLKYYVDQFGKDDAHSDMRWLLAVRTWNLNPDKSLHPHREEKTLQERKVQLIFAELMVRKFLKSPAALRRYYQAVIWFDNLFKPINYSVYHGTIYRQFQKENPDDDYWWHAFQFVLMVHATGRDDLLKDVKPEELKPRFQEWYNWFYQNGLFLRADPETWYWKRNQDKKTDLKLNLKFFNDQNLPPLKVRPPYPFPDWKGPEPTTPANYISME